MKRKVDAVTALERALGGSHGETDKVEPGYRTTTEWCTIWDLSWSYTRGKLKGHVKAGRMIRKVFRIVGSDGARHHTPHYKAV